MATDTSLLAGSQPQAQSSGWSSKNISSTELSSIASMGFGAAGQFSGAFQQFGAAAEARMQNESLDLQIRQIKSFLIPDISAAAEFQKAELRDSASSIISAIRVQTARSGMVAGQGSYAQAEQDVSEIAAKNMRTVDENAMRAISSAEIRAGAMRAQQAINQTRAEVANVMGWIGLGVGAAQLAAAGSMAASSGASSAATMAAV